MPLSRLGLRLNIVQDMSLDEVPQDIQMATLDVIKLIYKQDQEKKGFSFEGERGDKYPLSR